MFQGQFQSELPTLEEVMAPLSPFPALGPSYILVNA